MPARCRRKTQRRDAGQASGSHPRFIFAPRAPILDQKCHAHVIAPAARDPDVTPRKAFADEPGAAHERERARVRRLHVRLDAMELQPRNATEHELQAFGHVAGARVRREGVIAEVGALEKAADDFADVEHADDRVVVTPAHEKTRVRRGQRIVPCEAAVTVHEREVARAGRRRLHPCSMQPAASLCSGQELDRIRGQRRAQVYPPAAARDHRRGRRSAGGHNRNFTRLGRPA